MERLCGVDSGRAKPESHTYSNAKPPLRRPTQTSDRRAFLQRATFTLPKHQRTGAVQNLADFLKAPVNGAFWSAVVLYRFPQRGSLPQKYFKTRGVIGQRKTPWTSDGTGARRLKQTRIGLGLDWLRRTSKRHESYENELNLRRPRGLPAAIYVFF